MRNCTWALAVTGVALATLVGQALAQQPGGGAVPGSGANAKPVAVVNGEPITMAMIDGVLNRDGPKAVPLPEGKLKEIRQATLATMIDEMLFQQYIRKNCPPVNPQEMNQELTQMQEGLKQSGKTLEDFCKENGSTMAELRDDVADIVRWRTLVQTKTTDPELQRYYTDNKDFFDQIAVRASHIVIRVAATAPDAEKQAAIAKLKLLRQEIVSGKLDFAQAAQTNSQCPTAKNGGDLNFFPRKFMVDEAFARTAFAMKVGDVSDVVQTEFGYHLIKVTDRKPGTPSDFAKMKSDVREVYAVELRNNIVMQQRKVSKVEVSLP